MSDPIQQVKESKGELVLDFNSRVGARPFARYVDGEWDLMSLSHVPTPDYGEPEPDSDHPVSHNTTVHTVDLEPDAADFTESDLREIAKQKRYPQDDVEGWPGVEVIPVEESPFPDREKIPAKDDIIREYECPHCGEQVRQYLPDPFTECNYCGEELPEGRDD